MKQYIAIVASATTFLFANNAKAQFINDPYDYQRIEASYVNQALVVDIDDETDTQHTKGAEISYIKGLNITTRLPLFLELGGQLVVTHSNEKNNGKTEKYTFANIAIPVNLAYKLAFENSSNFSILPYVGPNFKLNIIGRYKKDDNKISFFDKDDVEHKAHRIQIGLNLGIGVNIASHLYVGYRFQPDFTKYIEDGDNEYKTYANYFTFGINF